MLHFLWHADMSAEVGNCLALATAPMAVRGHGRAADGFEEPFRAYRFGASDRCSKQSIQDKLGTHSKCPRDAEEDGIVVELGQTKQVEQRAGAGIHVRPWILNFALFFEDAGCQMVEAVNDPEYLVVRTNPLAEFVYGREAWIGDAKHGMAVAGYYPIAVQGFPDKVAELLVGGHAIESVANFQNEMQAFLIGQAVQRPRKAIHACRDGVKYV